MTLHEFSASDCDRLLDHHLGEKGQIVTHLHHRKRAR